VENSSRLHMHRARSTLCHVKWFVAQWLGNGVPIISPVCTQARHGFTQVMHTVVHSEVANLSTGATRPGRVARPSGERLSQPEGLPGAAPVRRTALRAAASAR
jgi:hypothetical protein